MVSAVTKIERDHMKYLGDTLEKIAIEKAGIAKPGVPFVIGETRPRLVDVLKKAGGSRRSGRGRRTFGSCQPTICGPGPLGLGGPHQRRNAAVAHGVLMALPPLYRPDRAAIERGFARARVPGRFDRRGKWLLDVAHNPDGMRALVACRRGCAATTPDPCLGLYPRRQGMAGDASSSSTR
jgi:dihydrofolate synthase/folylpolyglutamate synthase